MDKKKIKSRALEFAKKAHLNQKDDNGESYFEAHVLQVYNFIYRATEDVEIQCAAILHDTIEDTGVTYDELKKEFGERIANLVMELTHEGKKDEVGYYFPRLMSKDAVLIKFADRLSNLSRMDSWDKGRQDHYVKRSRFWKRFPGDRWRT